VQLSPHDYVVLQKMNGAGWITQYDLKTSRQTLNKLIGANLVERKITKGHIRYLPESGAVYRLKNMDDRNAKKITVNSVDRVNVAGLRNTASIECFK